MHHVARRRQEAEGTLAQAQAALTTAQRTLNGQQELFAIGAVSQQDLNTARDDLAKAQLSVQNAQASLNAARTQLETGSDNDSQSLRSQQIAVAQAKSHTFGRDQIIAERDVVVGDFGDLAEAQAAAELDLVGLAD